MATTTSKRGDGLRRRPWALVGSALVAIGAGVFVLGSTSSDADAPVVGANRPVNTGATDELDITSHNSPTVVRSPVDPDRLAVANRIDTPRFSCALHVSADAGTTWSRTAVPFPSGEEEPARCYAPDVAFGPDGRLYLSFVTLRGVGNTPSALWVVSSADGGTTLSTPLRVAGALTFQVRIATDPGMAGRVYLSWLQADTTALHALPNTGNPVVVVRSDDHGRSWTRPARVSPPSRARVVAPSTAVGRDGRLHLSYLDLGDDRLDYHGGHEGRGGPPYGGTWALVVARSDDQGATWDEVVVDEAVVPTERFIVFLPPSPSLAVDGRHVYVAFHDASLGDADVWVWTSADAGESFSQRRRVNDTPRADGTAQYLATLAVAPKGRLDVVYYDRRADDEDVMNHVSLQSSDDRGRSFGRPLRLSEVAFDSRIGYGGERGLPDLGSRLGLLSADRRVLAVWSDTRAGTPASQKQDLAMAIVALSDPAPDRTGLRVAGLALAGAGLALVTVAWRSRRRNGPGVLHPA